MDGLCCTSTWVYTLTFTQRTTNEPRQQQATPAECLGVGCKEAMSFACKQLARIQPSGAEHCPLIVLIMFLNSKKIRVTNLLPWWTKILWFPYVFSRQKEIWHICYPSKDLSAQPNKTCPNFIFSFGYISRSQIPLKLSWWHFQDRRCQRGGGEGARREVHTKSEEWQN